MKTTGLFGILLLNFFPAFSQKEEKPDFLIIITDQQRWDAIGAAGNGIIRTPNIDKLLQQGTYFPNAVSLCPVSGPARTSMLTGRFVEKTGIKTNMDCDNITDCKYKSYDEILVENGYTAEYYGKFHSPLNMASVYSNPPMYGFAPPQSIKKWELLYNFYLSENVAKKLQKYGELYDFSFYNGIPYRPSPIDRRYDSLPSGILDGDALEKRPLTQPDQHGVLALDTAHTITAVQAKQTIASLNRLKDKPFVITCSFHCPHAPMLPSEPYAGMYDPEKMPVPFSINDDMENSPYKSANGRLFMPEYRDSAKIKYMTAEYYASVTEIDHWVGRIMETLDALQLTDKTVVIFLSDHGEMLGAHGMREKNVFLEESVRVPLIIKYPKDKICKRVVEAPVSTLNIFSTILDYAGINSQSDGESLRPLCLGKQSKYDFAISEWCWGRPAEPNLMIRSNQWKLIINSQPRSKSIDALYDLKNDPYEMNNLLTEATKTKYLKVKDEMLGKLVKFLDDRNYPNTEYIIRKYK